MEDFKRKITFISIVPNLVEGEGHTIPYHQAVNSALKPLGWTHQVLVPQDASCVNLSSFWIPCLYSHDLEADTPLWQKVFNIYHAFRLGFSLKNILLKSELDSNTITILFLERFIHLQLLALCIAVWLLPRQSLVVWLLYRMDTHKGKTRLIYKLLNQLIEDRLPKHHFQLLTDSELLKQSLSSYFNYGVEVVPIPHTDFKFKPSNLGETNTNIIKCWWPGSPRLEKGWEIIQALTELSWAQREQICLMASVDANLQQNPEGILLKLLPNRLSRQDYDHWLSICDMVLLPYDAIAYQERTSGIFTEAIIAGKIPLVTANTWMEYELKQHDLDQDLVLNWEVKETVLTAILSISANPIIKEKLKKMQAHYQGFHNVNNYGQTLQTLYQKSRLN